MARFRASLWRIRAACCGDQSTVGEFHRECVRVSSKLPGGIASESDKGDYWTLAARGGFPTGESG